ncbi:MAG: multicopper oxidase domain-containing protein [Deltaproteobacteria bacterium]|nr:multicopper oxidase domain-containing protein [Deltaproteobacteria bacterium]
MKRGMSRREFIKMSAGATAALGMSTMLPWRFGAREAMAFSNSIPLQKFIQHLRDFGPQIPVAAPDTTTYANVDYYQVTAGWFRDQLHPSLPNPTRLYGYGPAGTTAGGLAGGVHLGNAIVATKGRPVRIKFSSALPGTHILPFDSTIPTAPGILGGSQDRAAIHLHGGLVPWASDGGPFNWVDPRGAVGASNVSWLPNATGLLTNDYYYPNNQSARLMWYHDHAIGTTRTSAYAGLASAYILVDPTDPIEIALTSAMSSLGDPHFDADFLVFQDKIFWNPALDPNYALYVTGVQPGDLWYPYLYERNRWKINGPKFAPPIPSAIPEFFGDTMLVNGSVYPEQTLDAEVYRFRLLNACNARFLNLKFVIDTGIGEPVGTYLAPTPAPVDVWIIGTEGGFLPAPVQLFQSGLPMAGFIPTPTLPGPLLMGPAERVDILVDFSKCFGQKVLLFNDAQAPFPVGAPVNDYYPGAPKNPIVTSLGFGPNTRTLMRFAVTGINVGPSLSSILGTITPAFSNSPVNPVLPTVPTVNGGNTLAATPGSTINHKGVNYFYQPTTQELTLNEIYDVYGRLMQLVGTNVPLVKGTFGRSYMDAPTETVQYGTIQVWNIYNLTGDTHPMHFHLFNAMILKRQPFQVNSFNGIPSFTGPGRGPERGEEGWKETVKMNPGECTTIAILVEDPNPVGRQYAVTSGVNTYNATLPPSPRLATFGVTGDEYVFHCHILEHEEHDMMRPLVGI